ncbi:MAG: hypothetical protein ACLFSQ_05280 [Candidatus Zixiibacteriota bacterium]
MACSTACFGLRDILHAHRFVYAETGSLYYYVPFNSYHFLPTMPLPDNALFRIIILFRLKHQ